MMNCRVILLFLLYLKSGFAHARFSSVKRQVSAKLTECRY